MISSISSDMASNEDTCAMPSNQSSPYSGMKATLNTFAGATNSPEFHPRTQVRCATNIPNFNSRSQALENTSNYCRSSSDHGQVSFTNDGIAPSEVDFPRRISGRYPSAPHCLDTITLAGEEENVAFCQQTIPFKSVVSDYALNSNYNKINNNNNNDTYSSQVDTKKNYPIIERGTPCITIDEQNLLPKIQTFTITNVLLPCNKKLLVIHANDLINLVPYWQVVDMFKEAPRVNNDARNIDEKLQAALRSVPRYQLSQEDQPQLYAFLMRLAVLSRSSMTF